MKYRFTFEVIPQPINIKAYTSTYLHTYEAPRFKVLRTSNGMNMGDPLSENIVKGMAGWRWLIFLWS